MLAQRDTDRGGRVSQKKKELELEESSVTVEEQDGMQPAVFSLSPDTLPNMRRLARRNNRAMFSPFFLFFYLSCCRLLGGRDSLRASGSGCCCVALVSVSVALYVFSSVALAVQFKVKKKKRRAHVM